jgi:hypothetical protein
MESSSTGTVPSPPEEGTFTFNWKEHSEEHVHLPPSNWSLRCKYCPKYLKGGKTRLVDHFLVGTSRCPSCPDDVVEGLKEERRVSGLLKEHRKRVTQQDG